MTISVEPRAVAVPPVPGADVPDDVDAALDRQRRRHHAVRSAAEAACRGAHGTDPDSWAPSVGVCRYGPGCVAVAVAGRPDRADVEHLRVLGREVDRLATEELVVDCSRLEECTPGLVRTLAGLRVRRLSAGARVELQDPPPELRAAVGPNPASAYVVDDAPLPRRSRRR